MVYSPLCANVCGERDIKAKMMRHIRYLSTLEVLSIKNNKIAHVNYHFCSLTNLQELSLSHNKLKVSALALLDLHNCTCRINARLYKIC